MDVLCLSVGMREKFYSFECLLNELNYLSFIWNKHTMRKIILFCNRYHYKMSWILKSCFISITNIKYNVM